jgi:hypothetical protein
MSRTVYALLIAICAILEPGCARRAILQPQPRVSFAPLPVNDVEAAIYEGCNRRKWIPSKVRDGDIEATLYLRSHVAVVDIVYDKDSFQVHYVRSENLNYKQRDGEELIHPNYNAWVKNLTADIDAALSQQRASVATRGGR